MINVKNFIWQKYERAMNLSKLVKSYPRKDIEESIFEENSRVKIISYNKFIVLGKTNKREYIFSVVHYLKKFTLFPVFVRPMNEEERETYEQFALYPY